MINYTIANAVAAAIAGGALFYFAWKILQLLESIVGWLSAIVDSLDELDVTIGNALGKPGEDGWREGE